MSDNKALAYSTGGRRRMQPIVLEDVRIVFKNFTGKEGQYNREGDRNFAAILPHDVADQMIRDGWSVKYLKPRDEDEAPQPYLSVKVHYSENGRPPRVVMVTKRSKTPLDESMVSVLDWAEIVHADITVRPYEWTVSGKSGVKAYLQTIFATIQEDPLEEKYADVPDSAQMAITSGPNSELQDLGEYDEVLELERGF